MIDTFHEHQLPVRPLGMGLVLEGSAQLLDGHVSVQDSVITSTAEEKINSFIMYGWMKPSGMSLVTKTFFSEKVNTHENR